MMKKLFGLWFFGIGGIITSAISAVIFYPLFYMLSGFLLFTFIIYIIVCVLFFPILIILFIEMLKLKKWAKNIFIGVILVMNTFLVWFLFTATPILVLDVFLVIFLITFTVYFFHPAIKKLFK